MLGEGQAVVPMRFGPVVLDVAYFLGFVESQPARDLRCCQA